MNRNFESLNKRDLILEMYRTSPEFYLEQMGVTCLGYGYREATGCCPLHEDYGPSFSINLETGLWIFFAGCGSGDLFSLYKRIHSFQGNFNQLLQAMERL